MLDRMRAFLSKDSPTEIALTGPDARPEPTGKPSPTARLFMGVMAVAMMGQALAPHAAMIHADHLNKQVNVQTAQADATNLSQKAFEIAFQMRDGAGPKSPLTVYYSFGAQSAQDSAIKNTLGPFFNTNDLSTENYALFEKTSADNPTEKAECTVFINSADAEVGLDFLIRHETAHCLISGVNSAERLEMFRNELKDHKASLAAQSVYVESQADAYAILSKARADGIDAARAHLDNVQTVRNKSGELTTYSYDANSHDTSYALQATRKLLDEGYIASTELEVLQTAQSISVDSTLQWMQKHDLKISEKSEGMLRNEADTIASRYENGLFRPRLTSTMNETVAASLMHMASSQFFGLNDTAPKKDSNHVEHQAMAASREWDGGLVDQFKNKEVLTRPAP